MIQHNGTYCAIWSMGMKNNTESKTIQRYKMQTIAI